MIELSKSFRHFQYPLTDTDIDMVDERRWWKNVMVRKLFWNNEERGIEGISLQQSCNNKWQTTFWVWAHRWSMPTHSLFLVTVTIQMLLVVKVTRSHSMYLLFQSVVDSCRHKAWWRQSFLNYGFGCGKWERWMIMMMLEQKLKTKKWCRLVRAAVSVSLVKMRWNDQFLFCLLFILTVIGVFLGGTG